VVAGGLSCYYLTLDEVAGVGILLVSIVCPAIGLCQTTDEAAISGETEAGVQPAREARVEARVEEPVYDSSKPIPAGYVLERRPHPGLRISGGVTMAASYAYTLLFALGERQDPEHATTSPGWLRLVHRCFHHVR
jgi:hypothetical protein